MQKIDKHTDLETAFRIYLNEVKEEELAEIFSLILEYMSHLFEEVEEGPVVEDLTPYEVDDFINFFLVDKFSDEEIELEKLQNKSKKLFQNFSKFLKQNKLLDNEAMREWKEALL